MPTKGFWTLLSTECNREVSSLNLKKIFFFVFCFVWKIMIPLDPVASVEKGRTLASLVAQSVKNLPAMQKTWVKSLGRKSPSRREWWPVPVFLPGEFHGQMSLADCSPWGRKESDRTEQLTFFCNSPPHFLYFHWYSAPSLPLGITGDLPSPHKRRVSWLGQNRCHRRDRISQQCSSQPLSAPGSTAEWARRFGGHSTVGVSQSSQSCGLDSGVLEWLHVGLSLTLCSLT